MVTALFRNRMIVYRERIEVITAMELLLEFGSHQNFASAAIQYRQKRHLVAFLQDGLGTLIRVNNTAVEDHNDIRDGLPFFLHRRSPCGKGHSPRQDGEPSPAQTPHLALRWRFPLLLKQTQREGNRSELSPCHHVSRSGMSFSRPRDLRVWGKGLPVDGSHPTSSK